MVMFLGVSLSQKRYFPGWPIVYFRATEFAGQGFVVRRTTTT
jgi:hypothetical protein